MSIAIKEIECKKAIGKCGFPGGSLAINPYVGCTHGCVYCYARFIKRFTKHSENWGDFVDARLNIADRVAKEIKSLKNTSDTVYIGTVTDPYQPVEKKYKLTRSIIENLIGVKNPISILTKSDLVLRDIDVIKKLDHPDINITINNLDENWTRLTEPGSSSVTSRLEAIKKLRAENITVYAMLGPWWPIISDAETILLALKKVGVNAVFSESVNVTGGNWTDVEQVLKKYYPNLLPTFQNVLFNPKKFNEFYNAEANNLKLTAEKLDIPITIYFGPGHAANKFNNPT